MTSYYNMALDAFLYLLPVKSFKTWNVHSNGGTDKCFVRYDHPRNAIQRKKVMTRRTESQSQCQGYFE